MATRSRPGGSTGNAAPGAGNGKGDPQSGSVLADAVRDPLTEPRRAPLRRRYRGDRSCRAGIRNPSRLRSFTGSCEYRADFHEADARDPVATMWNTQRSRYDRSGEYGLTRSQMSSTPGSTLANLRRTIV